VMADFSGRLTTALFLGIALAAGKLAATLSFFVHSPRELYSIPGVRTAGDLVELLLVPLLSRPRMEHLGGAIVNTSLTWNTAEFELGVGPVPLLILAVGAFVGPVVLALRSVRGMRLGERGRIVRGFGWAIALALLLGGPVFLNVYDPAIARIVAAIPLLRSAHAFFGYDAMFIPVVVFGSAVVVDRLIDRRAQWVVAAAAVALLVVGDQRKDADYGGGYDPAPIVRAHEQLRKSHLVPRIDSIAPVEVNPNRALPFGQTAAGVSAFPCYEPMFGYLLESFPKTDLHPGPVTDETRHAFNLLDPSCFVFPDENRCAPGDRIDIEKKDGFEQFRAHAALTFVRPWWQRLADATTLVTLVAMLIVLLAWALEERKERKD
jgi:hypothetical protein